MNSRARYAGALTVAAALALTVSGLAQAHHSFAATYKMDQNLTIQGTVVQFLFRSPHSYVHMMAPDKDGKMVMWAVEWAAGGALQGEKVGAGTLHVGDKVIVTGNPARDVDQSHRMKMQAIQRPSDGWHWAGTFG
jgi:hypothetical protein